MHLSASSGQTQTCTTLTEEGESTVTGDFLTKKTNPRFLRENGTF